MNKAAAHDVVRFLPRATTGGMVIVVILRFAGYLGAEAGFLDVIILAVVGLAARVMLRSWDAGR